MRMAMPAVPINANVPEPVEEAEDLPPDGSYLLSTWAEDIPMRVVGRLEESGVRLSLQRKDREEGEFFWNEFTGEDKEEFILIGTTSTFSSRLKDGIKSLRRIGEAWVIQRCFIEDVLDEIECCPTCSDSGECGGGDCNSPGKEVVAQDVSL